MITGISESKALTKHLSCRCYCKFDGRKCNLNQKWNKCQCESKNPKEPNFCKNGYIWNPALCSCENDKYLAGIIGDSVKAFHEIIKEIIWVPTNFNGKRYPINN